MIPAQISLAQIEGAGLPATVYRTAMRLWQRAICHPKGYVCLDKLELMTICETKADGTMRSHLVQLQRASILQYRTNGMVALVFCAWMDEEDWLLANPRAEPSNRALSDQPARSAETQEPEEAEEDAPNAHQTARSAISLIAVQNDRALSDQEMALAPHTCVCAPVGLVCIGSDPKPDPEDPDPNQTKPNAGVSARARGFLLEVGIQAHTVDRLPAIDDELTARIVFEWLPDYLRGQAQIGLVVDRLRHREHAPPLRAQDRASPLYRKHFPSDALPDAKSGNYLPEAYRDAIIGDTTGREAEIEALDDCCDDGPILPVARRMEAAA